MWKKLAIIFGCTTLLTLGGGGLWLYKKAEKFENRRTELNQCIKTKKPNQVCYMGHDGSITLRNKINGQSFQGLRRKPFVNP